MLQGLSTTKSSSTLGLKGKDGERQPQPNQPGMLAPDRPGFESQPGHYVSYLLPHNNGPKTQQLGTPCSYCLTISAGQEFGDSLAGSSAGVSPGSVISPDGLIKQESISKLSYLGSVSCRLLQ